MSQLSKILYPMTFLALVAPAVAVAEPLRPRDIFLNAAPFAQLLMIVLIGSTIAAIIVCVRKLMSGPRLSGGSAFLSGLRLGGPLIGLLGGAYNGLSMAIGIANVSHPVTLKVMAPGIAEAVSLIGLGMLAGAVAVIGHWAVEARIDRAVLKS
ncbi:hypothetical protein CSW58_03285 [Caulobacter sp. B11]|uniref:hypothetical protein n=1 Tax=Caulobacter sp. B11 TaxID=2048899 RepID=UPI000C12BD00|nr:hypothetical protein [Caulobacter sp. B11]PHY13822.1 hypothetical protein CSW58_03285 [Caulobacter sp. B11]